MNNIILSLASLFYMYSTNAFAEVWHSTQTWDRGWENEYQNWVKKNLHTDIFTSNEGLLGRMSTDCADALYAIRIKFAYENALPFVIIAPDVLSSETKLFGSDTSMFDSIKDEKKRVRAFINFILEESGTSDVFKNTYPIRINEIDSGIVYMVEWSLFGKINRHSYIIKGFDSNNELLYYASDAPRKIRKLQIDTKYPRFSYDSAPFGFRRWRHPEHLLLDEKDIPAEYGYSDEQYVLLERVGKKHILQEIRNILKNSR